MLRVAIIGGYGNFGAHVARSLAGDPAIQLIIAGRSLAKAEAFARALDAANPAEAGAYDLAGPPEALDVATVPVHDAAHRGQADARAFEFARAMQALEGLEQLVGVVHVEAGAIVLDAEHAPLPVPVGAEGLCGAVAVSQQDRDRSSEIGDSRRHIAGKRGWRAIGLGRFNPRTQLLADLRKHELSEFITFMATGADNCR